MEVGNNDTLRDECFLFLKRLVEADVESKLFLMNGLRHGYLNMETMLPSSKGICRQSGLILKELIEKTKRNS
jgi:acetyl esterase/lipase